MESTSRGITAHRAIWLWQSLATLSSSDIREIAGFAADPLEYSRLALDHPGWISEEIVRTILDGAAQGEQAPHATRGEPSGEDVLEQFRAVRAAGVEDPDVDLFIGVLTNDVDTVHAPLGRARIRVSRIRMSFGDTRMPSDDA